VGEAIPDKDLESLKPIVMKRLRDGSFGAQDSHSPAATGVTLD